MTSLASRPSADARPKSGWFGGWFKGGPKPEGLDQPKKAIKAKLGDANSFYYDEDLKKWVNKAAGASNEATTPAGTPPPPKSSTPGLGPTSAPNGTPPPPSSFQGHGLGYGPPMSRSASALSAPPMTATPPPPGVGTPPVRSGTSTPGGPHGGPPSGPPSRTNTAMGAADLDDLLGAPAPRARGARQPKKRASARYVDVMGGQS